MNLLACCCCNCCSEACPCVTRALHGAAIIGLSLCALAGVIVLAWTWARR